MTVEYNPLELNPIPRLFNYGKAEFEKYEGTFGPCHEMTYNDLVMNTSPNVHWVVFSDRMDYQGDRMALGIDAEDNVYLSVYGYGSCEICDPVLNCETKDEVIETFESIRRGIVRASTFKEMSGVIENKIMSDHILTEDWIGFLSEINDKFQGELDIVLNDFDPEYTITHIYEENVDTLDDFIRITTTLCRIFPDFNLLEMDIYPQWLHAYLLMTDADELSQEILESHKQRFIPSSFDFNLEVFSEAALAGKLAEILNACPEVVLAISSLDLTEYKVYFNESEEISDELLTYVKSLIHKNLNLRKFNNAHCWFRENRKPNFNFTTTNDFSKLKDFETTYSIRRDKYLSFSLTEEIESLTKNDEILYVRKQKG